MDLCITMSAGVRAAGRSSGNIKSTCFFYFYAVKRTVYNNKMKRCAAHFLHDLKAPTY